MPLLQYSPSKNFLEKVWVEEDFQGSNYSGTQDKQSSARNGYVHTHVTRPVYKKVHLGAEAQGVLGQVFYFVLGEAMSKRQTCSAKVTPHAKAHPRPLSNFLHQIL